LEVETGNGGSLPFQKFNKYILLSWQNLVPGNLKQMLHNLPKGYYQKETSLSFFLWIEYSEVTSVDLPRVQFSNDQIHFTKLLMVSFM